MGGSSLQLLDLRAPSRAAPCCHAMEMTVLEVRISRHSQVVSLSVGVPECGPVDPPFTECVWQAHGRLPVAEAAIRGFGPVDKLWVW